MFLSQKGDLVRWDLLFADLESQAAALQAAERDAAVDERTRIELSRIRLVERLLPAVDRVIRVSCRDIVVNGTLARVGAQWLLVDEASGRQALIATAAITGVGGLDRYTAPAESMGLVESRLGLAHVLRGIARDRSGVQVDLIGGPAVHGTIDRVGSDFFELAVHDVGVARRAGDVREIIVITLAALAVLRRDGGRSDELTFPVVSR